MRGPVLYIALSSPTLIYSQVLFFDVIKKSVLWHIFVELTITLVLPTYWQFVPGVIIFKGCAK